MKVAVGSETFSWQKNGWCMFAPTDSSIAAAAELVETEKQVVKWKPIRGGMEEVLLTTNTLTTNTLAKR